MKLDLSHHDYFTQTIEFPWPREASDLDELSADVSVTQPYGFESETTAMAVRDGRRGKIELDYPLIDDGRYASYRGNGLWPMGRYRLHVRLADGSGGALQLDPNSFLGKFDSPANIRGTAIEGHAQVDSHRQFIECSPTRAAFIGADEIGFTMRTISRRVRSCTVEVDVVDADTLEVVVGPRTLYLDGRLKRHAFDSKGWPRGEYWLRARVVRDGAPIGPFLVRQFWVETSRARTSAPALPFRPEDKHQFMVDGWTYATSEGLKHEPDQLERMTDGPVFELDEPWELGPKLTEIESISWDEEEKVHRVTYFAGPLIDDPRYLKTGNPSEVGDESRRYLCLAVSEDGHHWEKPDVGRVEYNGSKANNILRDMADEAWLLSGEFDSYPLPIKERPLPPKYRYRFYDAGSDGPVDMDRFVMRFFSDRNMDTPDQYLGAFQPKPGDFWGFDRRGDEFLALTRRPVLYAGHGMDLTTTTERASTYPFEGEPMALYQAQGRSTATFYDRRNKVFYYYYRPDYPPYRPNGDPYYIWHRVSAHRQRAVMWTRDGIHWERRHMIATDEHDPAGNTLYGFGFIRPWGPAEADTNGQLYTAAMMHWDIYDQTSRQELVWSRDHVHWHRFGANRKPMLPQSPMGSFDLAQSKLAEYYVTAGTDGQEEWWFPYTGNPTRYMLNGPSGDTAEELAVDHPYMGMAPFFTSWEGFFKEARSYRKRAGLARCKAGRLAHVEPEDRKGEFTTHPFLLEGGRLLINTSTAPGGSLRVEVQDPEGNVFPGLALADCQPFSGDQVAHHVRWSDARIDEVNARVVRLRFVLEGAKLYTWRLAQ